MQQNQLNAIKGDHANYLHEPWDANFPSPGTTIENYMETYSEREVTLYLSDCFICLKDETKLHFFYHFFHYWDSCPIDEKVVERLKQECAVFENISYKDIYKIGYKDPENYKKIIIPFALSENDFIGTFYSMLGNRIYMRNGNIYLVSAYFPHIGNTVDVKRVKEADINDLRAMRSYGGACTKTLMQSIKELPCFKEQGKDNKYTLLGAIAGDVIGSVYEWRNIKNTDFNLFHTDCDFTDDSVLTVAIADAILFQKDFSKTVWKYGNDYPDRGYGSRFKNWLYSKSPKPYDSFGNGSAMRVSAVGFACDSLNEVLKVAKQTAEISHNHPEGIKGAQATAAAIFMARNNNTKQEIKEYIEAIFNYDLGFTLDAIRPHYTFNETCQGSVPQAIVAFLESKDYEDAIRLAISIGGDSDTIACIAGGIAVAYYKEMPENIVHFVREKLPGRFLQILSRFEIFMNSKEEKSNTSVCRKKNIEKIRNLWRH